MVNKEERIGDAKMMPVDQLYLLYNKDKDFKEYVDKTCKQKKIEVEEALRLNILHEYAKYIRGLKGDRV